MIGLDTDPCTRCGHGDAVHQLLPLIPCLGYETRYVNTESGPLRQVTGPCRCIGYLQEGKQVSTPQAGEEQAQTVTAGIEQAVTDVDQAAADHGANLAADAAAATAVIHEANQAYSALHSALNVAHTAYLEAARIAHDDYSKVMAQLHHTVVTAAPGTGEQAGQ